ncbi:hypothetical protein [Marinicella meishanensis]|uniref:hypothetical protein n=1 Tax=Marinicella meishanensis TaxID=2873263 RepID=UPI001CBF7513|nr:hypothetical protein [Marinicella sp. NBU2979]
MKNTFLIIFLWITVGLAQAQIKPADGLWRTTDDPDIGSGMMMITQGGITLATVFSYTPDGEPRWYLAVGSIDENGRFAAELKETTDGTSILVSNPPSASYLPTARQLTIDFYGSQTASFLIDDQPIKTMQSMNFAYPTWDTEHQTLTDGTNYQVADPTGTWLVGGVDSDLAFVLDLVAANDESGNAAFLEKTFVSTHPSTDGWELRCPWQFIPNTLPFSQPFCTLDRRQESEPLLNVSFADLGVKQMQLVAADESQSFTGFRPSSASLQPNDGYWRPEDDPDVGGGLVLVSQGPYTVVLMYSYDEAGNAAWSIAAGAFDANGLLQTELRSTVGGSPIGIDGKTSATYTDQIQQLEIQLLGTELATFSVDGSPVKHIQNVNFGIELFKTEQLMINDKKYSFPDQTGRWVVVDNELNLLDVIDLSFFEPNSRISPAVPWYLGARGYESFDQNNEAGSFGLSMICTVTREGFDLLPSYIQPNCTANFGLSQSDFSTNGKVYFQDIGMNVFTMYLGQADGIDYSGIDRESDNLTFYRLR